MENRIISEDRELNQTKSTNSIIALTDDGKSTSHLVTINIHQSVMKPNGEQV